METAAEYVRESAAEREMVSEKYIHQTNATGATIGIADSWSDVARAAASRGRIGILSSTIPAIETTRKAKQVTIRIDNEEEKNQMLQASFSQLVQTFSGGGGAADAIIAARRTGGGDVVLQVATVEAREELEKTGDWAKRNCKSARVLRHTSRIAIHGVRIDTVDTGDQRVVIEGLKQDNRKLHPELDIVKAEWPGFASKPDAEGKEKKYSS